jgi:hypothetical protein
MTWVLLIGAVWLAAAVFVGVLIGRGIRLADRKQEDAAAAEAATPNFVVDLTPPQPAVAGMPAGGVPEPATPESAADVVAAEDVATPDRMRHPIPTVRNPVHAPERTTTPRESDLT